MSSVHHSSEYSGHPSEFHSQSSKRKEDGSDVTDEEKKAARAQIYKYLFTYPLALFAIIPSFASGAIPILLFFVFGDLIGAIMMYYIVHTDPMDEVVKQIIKLVLVAVAAGIAKFLDSFCWIRIGNYISTKLRRDLFSRMMTSEVSFFDVNPIGNILTLLNEDAQTVEQSFGQVKGTQISSIAQFLMGIILSFVYSWTLALIALCSLPATFLFTAIIIPTLIKHSVIRFGYVADSMTIAEEVLSSMRTVKGCNREEIEVERFTDKVKKAKKSERIMGVCILFLILCIMVTIWTLCIANMYYGAQLVDDGKLDFNNLFSVFGFTMMGCMGIIQLQGSLQGEQRAIVSGARILRLTNTEPTIPFEGGETIENFKGEIEFKNVSFKYPTRDVYVLRNVSFVIHANQMGALVGHSGSGKSTCVQLLERYYDANEGQILLDGHDIKTLDPRWLHRQIGLVQQEPMLFQMSVKENIKYGAPNATDQQVIAAAEVANALKFIEKLDNGFDQYVGEKGGSLSGGQRQRIAIARAVVKDPVVLITDEATSALDAASEKKVQQALDRVMQGRTSVIVAHRLSTIKNANIIYVFDAGEIKEIGTHQTLVKKKGYYYNLVRRQLAEEKKNDGDKKKEESEEESSSSSEPKKKAAKKDTKKQQPKKKAAKKESSSSSEESSSSSEEPKKKPAKKDVKKEQPKKKAAKKESSSSSEESSSSSEKTSSSVDEVSTTSSE